jgi:hypothetical protein
VPDACALAAVLLQWIAMASPLRRSLQMGACCAPIGFVAGALFAATATGEGYGVLKLLWPAASFLSGTAVWWLMVERRARIRAASGAKVGVLASVLSHFLVVYIGVTSPWVCYTLWGGCLDGGNGVNPVFGLAAGALGGAVTLVALGWLTVPAGAFVGWSLVGAERRRAEMLERPEESPP